MTRLAVIGDVMLDEYIFGNVERISPEAPVPILVRTHCENRLGGAANVAANCSMIVKEIFFLGSFGSDHAGNELQRLLSQYDNVKCVANRIAETCVKTRYVNNNTHLIRVDNEVNQNIAASTIKDFISDIGNLKFILLSDYNKGSLSHVKDIIKRFPNIKFIIDPKGRDYEKYRGAFMITPNLSEFKEAICDSNDDEEQILEARAFLHQHEIQWCVITKSSQGVLAVSSSEVIRHEVDKVEVSDVTGAGDVFISVLASMLVQGSNVKLALSYAADAATHSVKRFGTHVINNNFVDPTVDGSVETLQSYRASGKSIVVTNGCFDLLHAGHVDYLEKCAEHGDILVVLLNSDESVKRLKGSDRPINSFNARKAVLLGLACVDFVIGFEDDTPISLIEEIKPEVLIKGGDYSIEEIVGAKFVQESGGLVKTIPIIYDISTTEIISKIYEG